VIRDVTSMELTEFVRRLVLKELLSGNSLVSNPGVKPEVVTVEHTEETFDVHKTNQLGVFANGPQQDGSKVKAAMTPFNSTAKPPTCVM